MKRLALIVCLLLFASTAEATTFYVRTDGNNGNAGTSNSAGGAWRTLVKGCSAAGLAAGDIVRAQAGTYNETISGCTSGSSGNTITLVADGTVTTCGASFASKSYIRWIGLTFDPTSGTCGGSPNRVVDMTGTNVGLEFWNVTSGNTQGFAFIADWSTPSTCSKCIWIGGSMPNIGNPSSGTGIALNGNDNLVAYVNFTTICYVGVNPSGNRNRYLNLNFSGFAQCNGTHPDFFYIQGSSTNGWNTNVVESMFAIGTPSSADNKVHHAQNQQASAWIDDVWRFNVVYNTGSASAFSMYADSGTLTRWKFYSNSHLYGGRGSTSAFCGNIDNIGGGAITYSVFNNLYYQCWSDGQTTVAPWQGTNPTAADYNLLFDPNRTVSGTASWNGQSNEKTNVDPLLTNFGSQDFTLQSGSPARNGGGPLTTASGSGSSSTALTVASNTGTFFIGDNSSNLAAYGGKLAPGDPIRVGTCNSTVSSVSGDSITLASACTWSNADPVYYGDSSTIDIGAYPYKAGGYTLSGTYSIGGGTATITPSDASLVRFVVCYDSNVPTAVVNASPFTCSTGSGTFSAKLYPRYASQTLSVDATDASGGSPGSRGKGKLKMKGKDTALFALAVCLSGWRLRRREGQ